MSQTLCSAKLRALSQSRIIKSSHGCEENFSPEEAILLGVALNKHFFRILRGSKNKGGYRTPKAAIERWGCVLE
jgi:hypothetical protein